MAVQKLFPIKILIVILLVIASLSGISQCLVDAEIDLQHDCDFLSLVNNTDTVGSGINITNYSWIMNGTLLYQNENWDGFDMTVATEDKYLFEFVLEYDPDCESTAKDSTYFYYSEAAYSYDLGCPGSVTSFYDETEVFNVGITIVPVAWEWDFGNGDASTDQDPTTIYDSYGTYDIFYKVTNNMGCEDIINEPITLSPIELNIWYEQYCDSVLFRNETDTTAFDFEGIDWSFGYGGASSTEFDSIWFFYPENGWFPISVTLNTSYCDTTYEDTVFIARHAPSFDYIKSCLGDTTYFFGTADTIELLDSVYFPTTLYWDLELGLGTLSEGAYDTASVYYDPGDYIIRFMTENQLGCYDTISDTIPIGSIELGFTYNDPHCENLSFVNITDTNNIQYDSLLWNLGDGITSQAYNPNHTYSDPNTYLVELIVYYGNGCSDTVSESILVDFPSAEFSYIYLPNSGVEFTNLSTPYISPIIDYYWDMGDGTQFNTLNDIVTHYYSNPGSFEVCMTTTTENGCTNQYCTTVLISANPIADFTYSLDNLVASFVDLSVADTDIDPENQIETWSWDFGDGNTSTEQNPIHTYGNVQTYFVELEVCDSHENCDTEVKEIFSGKPLQIENLFISSFCWGDTTVFRNYFTNYGTIEDITWYMDYGDGTTESWYQYTETFKHFYADTGTYNLEFRLTGLLSGEPVGDTVFDTITVYPYPEVIIRSDSVCLNEYIHFYDISETFGDVTDYRLWTFGDGETSTYPNPVHQYADTGVFEVTLYIETAAGCYGSDTSIAKVNNAPLLESIYIEHACLNAPTFAYVEYDTTVADISQFIWQFNDLSGRDTTDVPYVSHVYTSIHEYIITLTAYSGGCFDTISSNAFLVYPTPRSDFDPVSDYQGVVGQVFFINTSVDPSDQGDLISYWDFGNGNTSQEQSPIEIYEEDGIYDVYLVSINDYGCTDTIVKQHEVYFRGLFVPTAFSPNNPDENIALFTPKGFNLATYTMQIYDMKGNLLWESSELDEYGSPVESWDGYYNGQLMPQGTYIWKAEASFSDGTRWKGSTLQSEEPKTYGTVTLIK